MTEPDDPMTIEAGSFDIQLPGGPDPDPETPEHEGLTPPPAGI
ncbi:hypothetical protein [Longispora fulva]|uniref:Uncharacterized protein n=1 Tax=Longispora fulva TaxID=619741 RepID=A0A8J7KUD5_9ACTN|nr:hypothetical protein [Longispora fulva]MBG6133937.1 hypothetical protein [Longispora fulva]